jgi:EmrB/QacA subfamily drug resistance transporter
MSVIQQRSIHKGWALALLASVQFMLILDTSIVTVALPAIHSRFHVGSESTLSWVVNGYLLTFGGLLLLGGRLGDRLGRRNLFFVGTFVFGLASLGSGIASSFGLLVAARFAQGAGAALVAPAALGLLTVIFEEGSERNKALGIWGAVSGSGGAAGLILGGILTTELDWRWVFFVNLPIVAVALAVTPRLLPKTSGEQAGGSFDLPGAAAVVLGISSLVYGFVEAGNKGWSSSASYAYLAVGAALLAVFVGIELRSESPLVRLSIFRSRSISGANLAMLTFTMASLGVWFYLALYLQEVHGYSALKAGVASLPLNVAVAASATMSSKWISRFGPKPVSAIGAAAFAGGLFWFYFITATSTYAASVLGPIILMGLGMGMIFVGLTVGAVSGVAPRDAGLASGLFNTTTQMGSAVGLAILSTVSTSQTTQALREGVTGAVALTRGYRDALLLGSGIAAASFLVIVLALSGRENRHFIDMVRSGGGQLEKVADAVAEDESMGALGGPSFERGVTEPSSASTDGSRVRRSTQRRTGDAA